MYIHIKFALKNFFIMWHSRMYKCLLTYYTVTPYDVMVTAEFTGDVEARPAVVEYGDSLTLNCTASGGPDNMLLWYKDDILLQSSNNVLNITAVSAADGGLYECVVNNTAGNSTVSITIYGKLCLSLNTL